MVNISSRVVDLTEEGALHKQNVRENLEGARVLSTNEDSRFSRAPLHSAEAIYIELGSVRCHSRLAGQCKFIFAAFKVSKPAAAEQNGFNFMKIKLNS